MKIIFFGVLIVGLLFLSMIGYRQMKVMEGNRMMDGKGMMEGKGMMNMSMIRHRFVMQNGINKKYINKSTPLQSTANNIKEGEILYQQNCAICHGRSGDGDGEVGKNLNPKPSNIAIFSKTPMATDAYLYWTISEGGLPLQTAMPSFKNSIKEDAIWKIIIFLRQL